MGWNAGLAPPAVWKAGAEPAQRHTPGERKGGQMDLTPGQERKSEPLKSADFHSRGYCG